MVAGPKLASISAELVQGASWEGCKRVHPDECRTFPAEREGHVRSFHVATAKHLRGLIVTNVDRVPHLCTNESMVYTRVGREFVARSSVIHSAGEYVRMEGFVVGNAAEHSFSIFKRGVIGTYVHMREAHLGRYYRKFDRSYNTRTMMDGERARVTLKGMEGERLTIGGLVDSPPGT